MTRAGLDKKGKGDKEKFSSPPRWKYFREGHTLLKSPPDASHVTASIVAQAAFADAPAASNVAAALTASVAATISAALAALAAALALATPL